MLAIASHHAALQSWWFQAPPWFLPVARTMGHLIHAQPALGLFLVIFAEELGVPLPAPGDAAITYGGYLTTTGAFSLPVAFVSVVAGATTGSFCLYALSRRYGHPFLVRFGPYIGLTAERLVRADRAFQRWGPWAVIIGRHIPGMRIVLSAFAGAFRISARVFVLCVLVSSSIWAAIFLELGRALGRNSRLLFRLFPAHLLPVAILVLVIGWSLWLANEQRTMRRRRRSEPSLEDVTETSAGVEPKAKGRTAKM